MTDEAEVLILGAGAAGLAAADALSAAGVRVLVLEARARLGGRVYTRRVADLAYPIELGAEFVHGRPPETFAVAERAGLALCDASGRHWYVRGGQVERSGEFWRKLQGVFEAMRAAGEPDRSLAEFLATYEAGAETEEARQLARTFVQGFHAARPERVGVQGLNLANQAEDEIDGDSSFRVLAGYGRLLEWLAAEACGRGARVQLETVAEEVRWQSGRVEVLARVGEARRTFAAARAVLTLPLGVLQAAPGASGAVRFEPALPEKEEAAAALCVGQVVRVVCRFREPFWERLSLPADGGRVDLADWGFIHAAGQPVPTWWTQLPARVPVLVGWAGGPAAEGLLAEGPAGVRARALASLAAILNVRRARLEELLIEVHAHDWQADGFARGAYSYVPVNGLAAQARLAAPVAGTLFFAGEATNTAGHVGTVHGALATGQRAAREVLASLADARGGL
ncbi:MAG TPA: NAD(P)/FAD-dependent oxidoreductase [Pyrinomonadaceae bacterium]|jgi:monoamine oxidase